MQSVALQAVADAAHAGGRVIVGCTMEKGFVATGIYICMYVYVRECVCVYMYS